VTWEHLQQRYGYFRDANFKVRTDFYLDPPCNLAEFKRISQASIHFEPILHMMMSNVDPNREAARSGIDTRFMRDTPGQAHLSRREATMTVEDMTSFRDLLGLRGDMSTSNTWAISLRPHSYEPSYAFRIAPQSRTVDDVIQWAEFAMSFVEASLSCALCQLLRFPPDHAGLHRFLARRGRGTEAMYNRNTMLTRKFEGGRGSGRGGGDPSS
jgi:hypothetical protein